MAALVSHGLGEFDCGCPGLALRSPTSSAWKGCEPGLLPQRMKGGRLRRIMGVPVSQVWVSQSFQRIVGVPCSLWTLA